MRVAIVGAGVMGLAIALELARRGVAVTIHERDVVGNELASSTDRSKVFRFAYPDPFYADLGRHALTLWRELDRAAAERLLEQCGVLYLDAHGATARAVDAALAEIGAPHELLDAPSIRERFPQLTPGVGTLGAWDPSGGFVRADRVVAALARLCRQAGVDVRERSPVADLAELVADDVVLAAGPWSAGLLPDLPLVTNLQFTVYARPRDAAAFAPERFPVFIAEPSSYYGVPVHDAGTLKLALHRRWYAHPPLAEQREADAGFIAACRDFWRQTIPALADAEVVRSRACVYNDAPGEDFLIGRHASGAVVCTGFSGHGFKFAPLIGRLVAQLVCGEGPEVDLGRFSLERSIH